MPNKSHNPLRAEDEAKRLKKILGQLREISNQSEDGLLSPEQLQAIIENRVVYDLNKLPEYTLATARTIFPKENIIKEREAAKVWNRQVRNDFVVPYSKERLELCIESNRRKLSDWRLVYIYGMSLRDQLEWRMKQNKGAFELSRNDWWFKKTPSESFLWSDLRPHAGYRLIDFQIKFGCDTWNEQEKKIISRGKKFRRTTEAEFIQAAYLLRQIHGINIAGYYHWGPTPFDKTRQLKVRSSGPASSCDFEVAYANTDYLETELGVSLCITPEI